MRKSFMQTRGGNYTKDQCIVYDSEYTLFVSYDTVIVKTTFVDGIRVVYLDEEYYNYSNTTIRYRNEFLGETSAEVNKKIKDGTYLLTNLNK